MIILSQDRLGTDSAELLVYEPRKAIDGEHYRLSIQLRVVKEVLPFLGPVVSHLQDRPRVEAPGQDALRTDENLPGRSLSRKPRR